jgi:alanyl-tRNA synthetase
MLGNWSFGDYFKKEAIEWMWTLMTEVYGLPKDRLYVSYFEGSPAQNLAPDEETKQLWLKYVPEDHIIRGNAKDNFWEMGDTGPCGPCTEIHFDRIGGRNAAHLVNKDDPMVLEVVNLVFIQFNREADGSLKELPAKHVDTGAGLERLVSALQDVHSNYDTDLWSGIFAGIQKVTKFPYPYDHKGPELSKDVVVAYRVVADHIRCVTVALADGAVPDAVGRGFVIRRIIRRAIRYGVQFLNAEMGFFEQLVDYVVESLGEFFPNLSSENTVRRVKTIIRDEEESFARTWKTGLKHFEAAKQVATSAGKTEIDPKDVFILHDRYGFPVDLTCLLAKKEGLTVDVKAFEHEMKTNQVSGGRMAAAKTFLDGYQVDELTKQKVPVTDDDAKYTWDTCGAKVVAIFDKSTSTFVESAGKLGNSEGLGVILDRTAYYAEAGGQVYDTGVLSWPGGKFTVNKVLSFGGYVVHIGDVSEGTITNGAAVSCDVDFKRRLLIGANHTCTHQLNHALREVLQYGKPDAFVEVNQKGSLVTEDQLRFDFSWNSKLTAEDIAGIEKNMTTAIQQNREVFSKEVPLADAMKITSLRCMFGEKYPDPVTVVTIGVPVETILQDPSNEEWKKYSIELCGGTHLKKFGEVQQVVIVSEDALMKGVRRVVAFTRQAAADAVALGNSYEAELQSLVKAGETDADFDETVKALSVLNKRVNDTMIPLRMKMRLRDDIEAAIKNVNAAKKGYATKLKANATEFGAKLAPSLAGQRLAVVETPATFGAEREALQYISEAVTAVDQNLGLFLVGKDAKRDKALAYATLPATHVAAGLSAVTWIQGACFNKGGGKPNCAQTGTTADKVGEVVASAQQIMKSMLATLDAQKR